MRRIVAISMLFAVFATAAGAATSTFRSSISINGSARLAAGGLTVSVSGLVHCSAKYRFYITLFAVQPATGAYVAGSFPGTLPTAPGPARSALYRQTICTSFAKAHPWTLKATSRGKVPVEFRAGSAEACLLVRFRADDGKWAQVSSACQTVSIS